MVQYCGECIHFENPTYEDWCEDCKDYVMWTEISCSMGHEIDNLTRPFVPFDAPCEDYEEE